MPTVAATTAPLLRVLSKAPEILVIAKFVVVACEVVACVAVIAPKVEDALVRSPPVSVESPVTPRVLESVADESVESPLAVSVLNVAPLVALN